MRVRWLIYTIVAAGAAAATWVVEPWSAVSPAAASPTARGEDPPILVSSIADDEMEQAMDRARASVDEFLVVLKQEPPGVYTAVKVAVSEESETEHLWLVDPRYEAGMIHGSLGNRPVGLTSWQVGDPAIVAPNEISDWMIIEDGVLRGGFTLRVARARMSPEEREAFDLSLGLRPE